MYKSYSYTSNKSAKGLAGAVFHHTIDINYLAMIIMISPNMDNTELTKRMDRWYVSK
jgi:hypothetical protein